MGMVGRISEIRELAIEVHYLLAKVAIVGLKWLTLAVVGKAGLLRIYHNASHQWPSRMTFSGISTAGLICAAGAFVPPNGRTRLAP